MKPRGNTEHGFDSEAYRQASPDLVHSHLEGMGYPSSKERLIDHARRQHAGRHVLSLLEHLPDRNYLSAKDLSNALEELE